MMLVISRAEIIIIITEVVRRTGYFKFLHDLMLIEVYQQV